MSAARELSSSFDHLNVPSGGHLAAAASAVADYAADEPSVGTLVIVVRPEADRHEIMSGGGTGVLRAAMSVAVAAGHDRLWNELPDGDTVERAVATLPEVVRAAVDGSDVVTVYAGAVRGDETIECAAFWFETSAGVAPLTDRRHVLELLSAAALRDADDAAQAAAEAEARAATESRRAGARTAPAVSETGERIFDPSDPDLDSLTGLATAECFDAAIDDFDGDEVALILIDLDDFDAVETSYGADVADRVVRTAADRLVKNLRSTDLVARVDVHRYGILLSVTERSIAMTVAKRLVNAIAEPLDLDDGPDVVTATVAMAHQDGLVDMEELVELADHAVDSGRRSGDGRLVLAS